MYHCTETVKQFDWRKGGKFYNLSFSRDETFWFANNGFQEEILDPFQSVFGVFSKSFVLKLSFSSICSHPLKVYATWIAWNSPEPFPCVLSNHFEIIIFHVITTWQSKTLHFLTAKRLCLFRSSHSSGRNIIIICSLVISMKDPLHSIWKQFAKSTVTTVTKNKCIKW